jgi:hypothetical protein
MAARRSTAMRRNHRVVMVVIGLSLLRNRQLHVKVITGIIGLVAQNIEQPVATIMVWAPLRLGSCTQRGSGTVTKPPGWPAGRR